MGATYFELEAFVAGVRARRPAGVSAAEALHAGDDPVRDGGARELGIEFVLVDHRGAHPGADARRVPDLPALGAHIRSRLP